MRALSMLISLCMAAAIVMLPAMARAQTMVVKMATLVPDGSVWHKILLGMGDEWSKETQGRVTLRLYPGGVAGDEPDMLRKMRIGQIHASAVTLKGLSDLDDAFEVFAIPNFFESYDELFAVIDAMEPVLKKRLEAKGFVLLNWGHAGWVYFFTKQPVRSLADLRKCKIWVWAGDEKMTTVWKQNGFTPVPLAATDILTGLQTGMIDALPTVPLGALQLQWYRSTPYMLDTGLAPLIGGTLITKTAWGKISDADRVKLLAACKRTETKLKTVIPEQDHTAVIEMQRRGLTVTHLKPEGVPEWNAETEVFSSKMRGTLVPPDILDLATRERNAYRQKHKH
jgi:TRAP-type C4-dicarboxylate transport system substrate-binding protein